MRTTFLVFLALVFFTPHTSWSAGKSPENEELRYRDDDSDGINDLFRDANGDGINDVTGKPYRHNFMFRDENGDGINDEFKDADGDGVNDHFAGGKGERSGFSYNVIDFDANGINDVTGKQYQRQMKNRGFFDENGDGIRDTFEGEDATSQFSEDVKNTDKFQDEDGDGINDGRGFGRDKRNIGGNRLTGARRGERNP